MESLVDAGLAAHIGLSNHNQAQIGALLASCRIRPAVHQIELHPYNCSRALVEYCARESIVLTAYSLLGHGSGAGGVPLLEAPAVAEIAAKRGLTPAQVLVRFQVERGIAAIPKSITPARIASNLDAASPTHRLERADSLLAMDVGWRFCAGLRDRHLAQYPWKDELPVLLRHAARANFKKPN